MSDSSSGDDASFCSNCAQVHEVFSRPHDSATNGSGLDLSFGVELSREDAMDVIDYFKGLAEQNRICRCLFATRERFWILHRTVVETMMVLCRAENSMDISTSSSIRSDDGSSIEQQQRLELAIFVQNALNDAFPLYQIYRRDPSLHDPSDKLDRDTLKFADKHPHISYALCRTIRLLMDASFLERLADLFSDCDREAISPKLAHAILLCVVPLRFMLAVKYRRHTEGPFEHCAEMFIEMVKNDQEIVRNHSFRVSVDLIWRFAIEDMDDSDAIDKASLRLAAAHLESPYLSPKINGMTHISEVVRAFTDITTGDVCEADGESSSLRLQTSMAEHLQKLKIVSRVFELSGHPELIKQCFTVMEFMARYGTLTVADLDAVWAAAQKKECTRHVFDLLSTIVKHLEPALILYMHSLLRAMKPNEHNELSLNLSLHCAEMIWRLGIIKAQYIRGFGSNQMNATSETATERIIVGSSGAPSEAGTSISGDSNEVANVSSNQPVGGRAPGESSLPRPTCGSNANDPLNATFSADDDDWTSRSIIREKLLANQSLTPQSKPFDAIGKRPSDEKIGGGAGASKKVRLGSSGDSPSPLVLSPIRPIYDAPVLMYHRPSSPNKIPLHGPEIDQHRILLDRLKTGQHVGNRSQRPQLAHDGEETSDSDEDVSSDRATSRSHSMAGLDDDDLDELRNSSHSPPAHVEHIDNDSIPPRYPSVLRPHPSVASASRSQPINSIYVHTYRVICESVNFPLFQVDKVCQPGNTLLWDLMCDETEEAMACDELALCGSLLFDLIQKFASVGQLPFAFVVGIIDNLNKNRCAVPSLTLLSRILDMLIKGRRMVNTADDEDVGIVCQLNASYHLTDAFFDNFRRYFADQQIQRPMRFSHEQELEVRLDLLSSIYRDEWSSAKFSLQLDQFDLLWDGLFPDVEGGGRERLFKWLLAEIRARDSHAIDSNIEDHFVRTKLSLLDAETMSANETSMLKALLRSETDAGVCLRLLWRVALQNASTLVSRTAMNYLSEYYLKANDSAEATKKEYDFVRLCMDNLRRACDHLASDAALDSSLTEIVRALLILKTHLDDFRKRYSYAIRKWELADPDMKSHQNIIAGSCSSANPPMHVYVQMSGDNQKMSFDVFKTDTLGQLRADVCDRLLASKAASGDHVGNAADVNDEGEEIVGASEQRGNGDQAPQTLRLFFGGRELTMAWDMKSLSDLSIRDSVTFSAQLSSRYPALTPLADMPHRQQVSIAAPDQQASPIVQLLQPDHWNLLTDVIDRLFQCASTGDIEQRHRCYTFASRAWEIICLLPTNPDYKAKINTLLNRSTEDMESESESDVSWSDLLDSKRIHCLQYTLQIIDGMLFNPDVKQKFVQRGGLRHVMHVLLQKSLIPDKNEEWSQWLLDCLTCLLRTVIMSSVTQASDDERLPGRSRDRRSLGSPPESVSFIDISLLSISGNNLVAFLMDLIENLATERSIAAYNYANKAASVSFAFGLLTAVLTSSPELQSTQFLTYPSLSDWLRLVLVDTCPAYIRHESMLQLYRLCKMKLGNSLAAPGKPLVVPLLKTLLASLDHVQAVPLIPAVDDLSDKKGDRNASAKEMYGPSSVHYFQLVHGLLESLSAADVEKSLDLSALLCETTTYLESRPFFEHDDTTVDSGLRGLLILACDMIKVHKSWKTSEAATHLLSAAWDWAFAVPCNKNKSAPKCKHTESRLACFDLIIELCSGVDAHVAHVYLWLTQQHSKAVDDVYPWDYWPEDERRAPCGHVGLINLGATCYMATALQHLFMIPQCRVAILNFDPSKAQKHVGELVEMQKLFAFLNESKRKAYDPRELCKSYHMDGVVLNTAEQKDMTEFFTDCITKLEEMGPELRDMVRQLFCGVMVNSVVSESCSHVSKTTEEFYSVRCQVSDMKDLYASLDELTVADVLEGDNMYNCSQCNDKVKATKRTCFKHLPDILSFNTMRYSFNMLTMTKEKVNSHFSFPDRLSMSGYMERSLLPEHAAEDDDRQSTDYLLIGVTVHTGTADGGHYYSFIRDPHDDEKWYSFNDADVKLWDPANMALECFGGEMTRPMFDTTESRFMDLSFEKANSAYMVFYRRIPSPGDVAQLTTEVRQSSDLTDFIAKDNLRFVRDLMVFNHSYSQFVWQMCGEVPKSLTNNNYEEVMFQSAQLSLRFVLETLIHAKEKPMIQAWIDLLVKFLGGCPRAAEWFLDSMANDPKWPMEILIKCPIASCRQLFEKLVSQVIIQLHDKHQPLFCAPFSPGQNASEVDPRHVGQESSTTRFLAVLLSILSDKDLAVDMRQLTELFSLLATFAHQSAEASHFLILAGAPAICVRFYLRRANEELLDCSDEGDDDELTLLGLVRNSMLNRSLWVGPGLDKMCQLLCILLSRRLSLRKECTSMLLNGPGKGFPFLMQMCRDSSNVPIAANLIISVAELGRFQYGKQIMAELCHQIMKASKEQQAVPFFNILSQLCVQRPSGSVDTMDTYATLVAEQVWQCAEQKPVFFLQWLERAAPHSPVLLRSLTERLDLWVEKYLLKQVNSNGRQAAGSLLLSLVPSSMVRQRYSSFIGTHRESSRVESISTDAQHLLHTVYEHLLCLLENAVNYLPGAIHSQNRLVYYFSAMRACLVSNDEKKQLIPHLEHLWQVYEAGHDVTEKGDGNRQALLLFWHAAVVDCPEVAVATLALTNSDRASHLIANYVVIDMRDNDLVKYNRTALPAFYGLLRQLCERSIALRAEKKTEKSFDFANALMRHPNVIWALKHVAVHCGSADFGKASEEILLILEMCCKLKWDVVFKPTVWRAIQELTESTRTNFLIFLKALKFLIDTPDDKLYLLENNVLNVLSDALMSLHEMFHQATACYVVNELVEVLRRLGDFLTRTQQCSESDTMKAIGSRILLEWKDPSGVASRLLTLLNSFQPNEVRTNSLLCLRKLVSLYLDNVFVLRSILHIIYRAHNQRRNAIPNAGPFLPKRGEPVEKIARTHPPCPLLDMTINPMLMECAKGVDPNYDTALNEYYAPYISLCDLLLRSCVNLIGDGMSDLQLIADTSTLLATEALHLHLIFFPKFWIDVLERNKKFKMVEPLLTSLARSPFAINYVLGVFTQEPANLFQTVTMQFFENFLPMIFAERPLNVEERALWLTFLSDSVQESLKAFTSGDDSKITLACQKLTGCFRSVVLMSDYISEDMVNTLKKLLEDDFSQVLKTTEDMLISDFVSAQSKTALLQLKTVMSSTTDRLSAALEAFQKNSPQRADDGDSVA